MSERARLKDQSTLIALLHNPADEDPGHMALSSLPGFVPLLDDWVLGRLVYTRGQSAWKVQICPLGGVTVCVIPQ